MKKLVGLALLLSVGCGGHTSGGTGPGGSGATSGSASCTYTETISFGNTTSSFTFCGEASGLTSDQINSLKMTCVPREPVDGGISMSGVYSDGPCPLANRIGGCTITSGAYTQTAWYYGGGSLTADDVPDACKAAGGTYIKP